MGVPNAMCRGEMVHRCFGATYGGKCVECVAEERDLLRDAIQRHRDTIGWCGEVRVADERSAEIAKLKHQADFDLWGRVDPPKENDR